MTLTIPSVTSLMLANENDGVCMKFVVPSDTVPAAAASRVVALNCSLKKKPGNLD
jgi:hypothetical protein